MGVKTFEITSDVLNKSDLKELKNRVKREALDAAYMWLTEGGLADEVYDETKRVSKQYLKELKDSGALRQMIEKEVNKGIKSLEVDFR